MTINFTAEGTAGMPVADAAMINGLCVAMLYALSRQSSLLGTSMPVMRMVRV